MLHLAMAPVLRTDPAVPAALLDHMAFAICSLFQPSPFASELAGSSLYILRISYCFLELSRMCFTV